ncbi:MAG: hypothetical protein KDE26_30875, partial [Bacteroidetes bacterium]|nr:hypothetical protein [Bacteroidota bacterium]
VEIRINEIHNSINTSMELNRRVKSITDQIKEREGLNDLKQSSEDLSKKLEEWQSKVIELRQKGFQDALNWPAGMNSEFFMLRNNLDTYDPRIPEGYNMRFQDLEGQWIEHQKVFEELLENEVKNFNDLYRSKELPALEIPKVEGLDN